jgi:hypothetical protein
MNAMAENKAEIKSQSNPGGHSRIIQVISAPGWRVFEFSQDPDGKLTNREVPVIGWGLQENGNASLLIPHPSQSNGHAIVSIADAPPSLGEKDALKSVHYQAITPFQLPADAEAKAQFVLHFVSSNIRAADDRTKGKSGA